MKRFISIFCAAFFFISALMFPLTIHAENATYNILDQGVYDWNAGNSYKYQHTYISVNTSVRAVILKYSSYHHLFIVSENSFMYGTGITNEYNVYNNASSSYGYYLAEIPREKIFGSNDIPIINYTGEHGNATQEAIYYTFGEGAIGPIEPVNWGLLSDVGFQTKIAGSGQAAVNNIDNIKWNPLVDSYGNEFDETCKVQIRAVPGQYSGSNRENLIEQTYRNFILDNTNLALMGEYPASQGSISYSWQSVINKLNLPFASISSLLNKNGSWIKQGWIYQYRLIADGFDGDWKTIYTLTSSGVKNDIKVININVIDEDVIQFVTDITDIDVDVDIVIIYEDIVIPPLQPTPTPNPSVTPSPVDPDPNELPWWVYLLNAILDLIRSITEGIASIISSIIGAVSDIINGILRLFSFETFEIPDFNVQMQNIKDNSGMVGESLTFTQNLKNTFEGVQYAEPVLHWQGISIDGVTIIPAADYNLNTYVEQLGLSNFRQIAYTVTDGMIYFSLVLLIIKKIEGIFKK